MSALAGILRLDGGQADAALAERMALGMGRRGPDDDGGYRSPGGRVAMAARRLAVVGRAESAGLPIANETHDVWLALDGEIFNHRALRHGLELDGHRFRSNLDAEAALHGYEQWGLSFLEHLHGEFALALWDDRLDRLVLARDRMGRKPMYFAEDCGTLGFASAVAPLAEAMGLPRRLDRAALREFLAAGWVAPPRTLHAGVLKLAAGEMLVADRDGPPYRSRWCHVPIDERRAAAVRSHGSDRHVGNVRTLIECSIADRLMGDAPVGALLGTGLDGGIAAAVAVRLSWRPVTAVTVVAAAAPDAATRGARLLAAAAGADLHLVAAGEEETAAALPALVADMAEPLGDPACMLWWWAGRGCAEAGLAAALSGEGADELLLTHPAYASRRASPLTRLGRMIGRLAGRCPTPPTAPLPPADPGWRTLLGCSAADTAASGDADHPRGPELPGWLAADPLAAAGWLDLTGRVPELVCGRADSMTAGHGVAIRLPFLDDTLVAYATAMPSRQRSPAGTAKLLLHRAAGDLIPAELVGHSHRPDTLPVGRWLAQGPLSATLERAFDHSSLFRAGILSAGSARSILAAHRSGGGREGLLFTLLALCQWCDRLGVETVAEAGAGWDDLALSPRERADRRAG